MSGWTYQAENAAMPELAQAYDTHGFVIVKGLLDRRRIDDLLNEAEAICRGEAGDVIGAASMGDGVGVDDSLLSSVIAIHFPHKVSELMRLAIHEPEIVRILRAIIGPDIKCMQSMLFVKGAGKPGQAWHQDEHFIPTRDQSLCGVWIALDDARIDNGALWMHPGSHQSGVLWQSKRHDDERFDATEEAVGFPFPREGGVPVEIDAGDVAFFHGYTLHRSLNNTRKDGFRRSLVNHYMSARSMLPWSIEDAPAMRDDFRDFELVSGEDPYAWKGKQDLAVPFIRPADAGQAKTVFAELAAETKRRAQVIAADKQGQD